MPASTRPNRRRNITPLTRLASGVLGILAVVLVAGDSTSAAEVSATRPAFAPVGPLFTSMTVPESKDVASISCPSSTTCWAVGTTTNVGDDGILLRLAPPGVQSSQLTTDALSGVACTSAQRCFAVGFASDGNGTQGTVTLVLDDRPRPPHVVPGTSSLDAIACPSPTTCYAVGTSSENHPVYVALDGGVPSTPVTVPNSGITLQDIACESTARCLIVGTYSSSDGATPRSVIVGVIDGKLSARPIWLQAGALSGIACHGTACLAVGSNGVISTCGHASCGLLQPVNGLVATLNAQSVLPVFGSLSAVTCPSASACEVVGSPQAQKPWVVAARTTIAGKSATPVVAPGDYLQAVGCLGSSGVCWASGDAYDHGQFAGTHGVLVRLRGPI